MRFPSTTEAVFMSEGRRALRGRLDCKTPSACIIPRPRRGRKLLRGSSSQKERPHSRFGLVDNFVLRCPVFLFVWVRSELADDFVLRRAVEKLMLFRYNVFRSQIGRPGYVRERELCAK